MYLGFAVSLMCHAALLGWAVYSIQATPSLPLPEAPTIEARLITPAEFTRLRQGDPDSEQMDAKPKDEPKPQVSKTEAEKPKPKAAPPPPASEPPPPVEPEEKPPEKAAEKEPEPPRDPIAEKLAGLPPPPEVPSEEEKQKLEAERQKVEQEKKRKAEAERKKREAAKRKEEARKKKIAEEKRKAAEKKKREFDADRIAALLDKTPEKRGSPQSSQYEPSKPTDYTGPVAGEREGRGNELTAREADLLKGRISAQIRDCWRLPGGGGGIETTVVKLRWRLKQDGGLEGIPEILGGRSDPVYQIAAEAAKRAVICAAPFNLPPESYQSWRIITWDFDPRHML